MLEAENGPHRAHAVILAIDDQKRRHFAAEADAEQSGEHVELPGILGPKKEGHGYSLDGIGQGHHSLGPKMVRQDWGRETAGDAGEGICGGDPRRRLQPNTQGGCVEYDVPHYYGMPKAAQMMDQYQVPK